jgi:hypothetical protein
MKDATVVMINKIRETTENVSTKEDANVEILLLNAIPS